LFFSFSSSENFSCMQGSWCDCLYTPSSRHEHGAAFCKVLREDFLYTCLSSSGYSDITEDRRECPQLYSFLAALEEAYEMEAYIIGGDCCRLTRQSVCPWQHHKATLTDSTEFMFPILPKLCRLTRESLCPGQWRDICEADECRYIRQQKRNCQNKLTLAVV
jgi:hypothetical protein